MCLALSADALQGTLPPQQPLRGPALAFTQKEPCPPRLCPEDLRDPNAYHRRLVEWLLKLR